jgi:hypothetical protein
MCDKNLYSGNTCYHDPHTESLQQFSTRSYCTDRILPIPPPPHTHTHTGRLQAINTHVHAHTNSSPVQQISSAHAVLSCVDAECILKHHHLLPWSHTHSIWHQVYEHLSPLWHLSPAKTNRPYSSDPGAG